jgi:Putative transposase
MRSAAPSSVFVRAVLGDYRRRGLRNGQGGAVTVIQRFGSGLQLNVHYHSVLVDGVFTAAADGSLRFHPAPPPTDAEVGRLLATIRTRILRLLRRRGMLGEPEESDAPDPLAETSVALPGIASAPVQGLRSPSASTGRIGSGYSTTRATDAASRGSPPSTSRRTRSFISMTSRRTSPASSRC